MGYKHNKIVKGKPLNIKFSSCFYCVMIFTNLVRHNQHRNFSHYSILMLPEFDIEIYWLAMFLLSAVYILSFIYINLWWKYFRGRVIDVNIIWFLSVIQKLLISVLYYNIIEVQVCFWRFNFRLSSDFFFIIAIKTRTTYKK